jgi:hypothetical protein
MSGIMPGREPGLLIISGDAVNDGLTTYCQLRYYYLGTHCFSRSKSLVVSYLRGGLMTRTTLLRILIRCDRG